MEGNLEVTKKVEFVFETVKSQKSMEKLKFHHKQLAQEKGYHIDIFSLVDAVAWDSHSIFYFGVGGQEAGVTVDIPTAVELLQ